MIIKWNSGRLWLQIITVIIIIFALWLLIQGFVSPRFNSRSVTASINNLLLNTGRVVHIEGGVHTSIFPSPNLTIERATLTARDGKTTAIKVNKLRLYLSWWQLLHGKYVVDSISLNGAYLAVARFADGSLSLNDLFHLHAKNIQKFNINLDILKVRSSTLVVTNLSDNSVDTLDSIDIDAHNLQTQKASFQTSARFDDGSRKVNFILSAPIVFDKNKVKLSKLDFSAKSNISNFSNTQFLLNGEWLLDFDSWQVTGKNVTFDLQNKMPKAKITLVIPNIKVGFNQIAAKNIQLIAEIERSIDKYKFYGTLANVSYKDKVLDSSSLVGQIYWTSGKNTIGIGIAAPLHLSQHKFQLEPIALSSQVYMPFFQKNALAAKLTGKASGSLDEESFVLYAYGKIDDSNITLCIQKKGLFIHGYGNNIYADISLDKLDLNHYLLSDSKNSKALFNSSKVIDLSWLDYANFNADITIGNLIAGTFKLNNFIASAKVTPQILQINNIQADMYDGRLTGKVKLSNNKQISVEINQELTNVDIEPIFTDLFGFSHMRGRGDSSVAIYARGNSFNAWHHTMTGNMKLHLTNGALTDVDLINAFKDRNSRIDNSIKALAEPAMLKTEFNDLSATIQLKNGVANNKDLLLTSRQLKATGHGKIDLVKGIIDYTMDVKANSKKLDNIKNFNVPLKITGPIESPLYALDFNAMVEGKKTEAEKQKAIKDAFKHQINTILQ